jgi:alkylation response protein AidB-like acyl-CoA dehydrogenase
VWASSGNEPTIIDRRLTGTKRFCSGVGVVDRALVTVQAPRSRVSSSGALLVDVDVRGLRYDPTSWSSPALADTATGDATFDQPIADADVVDTARWYLDRPGFWHGACGPAACWAGGAIGLIDAALRLVDTDPHRVAHTGAMVAARWSLEAIVHRAGEEIDLDPADRRSAEIRARSLRHVVERTSSDVADRFSRAFGPRPFVSNAAIAQRFADLHLYMRQHHAERELGELTDLAIAESMHHSNDG